MESIYSIVSERWFVTLVPAVAVVMELLAIFSAFHALRHVRTSQAAVAWVVALVTLPFFTLLLYWIFARHRFSGYREAIRDVEQRHRASVDEARRELSTQRSAKTTTGNSPLEQVADVLDTPISGGNAFQLLIDGDAFFDAILEGIRQAQKYVYVAFYIIRDDETGNRFADALIERAKEGITVRLLYDEIGSVRLSQSYLDRLTEAGVDARAFNTRQGFVNRLQINFRNHRKLVVVDGTSAMVGGLNVGDEYVGKASWVSYWRDTAVGIRGPFARKVQAVFAGDYFWAARSDLPEANWNRDDDQPPDGGRAAVCATGPSDVRPRATMMFAAVAASAQERLWISTPYLVPDEAVMVALSMARARGVDVRVLIPSIADQWAVFLAGFHYELELAELDIPVYRFREAAMHQKCVLVDDRLAMIGSTNLDNRSLYLNFEMMVAIEDTSLVADVEAMLEKDFANAQHSNASEQPLRPWFARAGTTIARLFSPVL